MSIDNKFTELVGVLDQLTNVSRTILKKTVELYDDVKDYHNSDIVDEIKYKLKGQKIELDDDQLKTIIDDEFKNTMLDADIIRLEMPHFTRMVWKGEQKLYSKSDQYPFLYQAWAGDMYPETKINALRALLSDLKNQSKKVTEEKLIQRCINNVVSGSLQAHTAAEEIIRCT